MRKVLFLAVVVLIGFASLVQASTITIHFNEVGSKVTGIFMPPLNSNSGTDTPIAPVTSTDWYQLYYFVMPAELAGATINGASFSANSTWSTSIIYDNIELHRINSPVTWDVGNGSWSNRWGNYSGAGRAFAQCTLDSGGNVVTAKRWDGGVTVGFFDTSHPVTEVIGDLVNVQNGFTTNVSFDVTSLVQNWADGTWDNDGFIISEANAVITGAAQSTKKFEGPTLLVDFTPGEVVPEPATMLLVGSGILGLAGFLRRRRM